MRKLFALAASAALISTPAFAVTLKADSPACISEDYFLQLAHAIVSNDTDAVGYLSANACTISGKPVKVTVLDLSDNGMLAHIRAYRGKIAAEMWTLTEDLDGYDPSQP